MRLITDGVVDREGVPGLARAVGYSERHLNRLMTEELGAGPTAIARAQRAQNARTLLESTDLPITRLAYAAGFSSTRQFNDTIREVYATTPTELRRASQRHHIAEPGRLSLRLAFRPPFAVRAMFGFFAARAITGVEHVTEYRYARTLRLPHGNGRVVVEPAADHLVATVELDDISDLAPTVRRLRDTFDLDADPETTDRALRRDSALRAAIRRTPGLRVPGTPDPTELVVRAVLGQQVSVAGARTLASRMARELGTPSRPTRTADDAFVEAGLEYVFPNAATIAASSLDMVGMPNARRSSLRAACDAVASGAIDLGPAADRAKTRAQLIAIKGIGPWTADYIAMRALRDPDAFLPTDLGVRHGIVALGANDDTKQIAKRAEAWRPWRSYALMHLWNQPDPSEASS
jgi:AraC family transcriptional regulator of adaptative response / DNA-3-methyladenine glycosylase II